MSSLYEGTGKKRTYTPVTFPKSQDVMPRKKRRGRLNLIQHPTKLSSLFTSRDFELQTYSQL